MEFSLRYPSHIIFGEHKVRELGQQTKVFGTKSLIVTGKNSMEKSGILREIADDLEYYGIKHYVFDGIYGEPDTEMVDQVRRMIEEEKIDFVVGLGGGSALDVAKAAAGLYGQNLPTAEYLNQRPFEYQGIPFVAIPTTAGTGSEITLNAVLYHPELGNKNSLAHPGFQSKCSIVDPVLTYSMAPEITAMTGMDALTHAVESYTSKMANPVTMAMAGKAISLIAEGLPMAVKDGSDKMARSKMALGSMMAALAFAQTGVGVAHAISHPLGALFHIPHGLANAILLPTVIDYNDRCCHHQYVEIEKMLGIQKRFGDFVRDLLMLLPIPQTLTAAGYIKGKEEELIRKTFTSRSLSKNPRLVQEDDVMDILQHCL
ncbi:alcohol dehydrogenase [Anaerosolibacter carboniphilus]|uniref:Alcohol dehydrogenase n=1 Tax=Anaerosolibacter carboniphilus TaxID=1417629 RepID=A0A841L4T5_9FIRM|nr:iron-containing alcohol dehydrogenase [Anaerosolibacter carboniphilus]MBB6217419.1 alcohol dehydrogenase [Anaerosolibacter carboniphilus]